MALSGANTAERREKRSIYVEGVLKRLPIIEFELAVARRHARIWAELEVSRKMIGPHDLIIAATALDHGHSLATLNQSEFSHVSQLMLEDVAPFAVTKP